MSKIRFELDPRAVAALNRRAESIQRAAVTVLRADEQVPLIVFDEKLQVPPSHQLVEGFREETQFGVAITPKRIVMHPREVIAVADETAQQFPNLPDQELLQRVDAQIWKFLVMTTIEHPAQGREDLEAIVRQTFSSAFDDWASKEYGVKIPKKSP